jgi:hypothetical protein
MKNTKATSKPSEALEFEPDAWERFERAVSIVARAPPQHRPDKRTPPRHRLDKRTIHRLPPEAVANLLTVPSDQAIKILESELYSKIPDGTKG